jgi:hypothetical protein
MLSSFCLGLLLSAFTLGSISAQEIRPPQAVIEGPGSPILGPEVNSTQARPILLEGVVAEIFGNRFILEAGSERVLVEPLESQATLSVGQGDRVRVEGHRGGSVLRAGKVSREGVDVLTMPANPHSGSALPAPQGERPGILTVLQNLGLAPIGTPVRKKHHTEILARMMDGRTVYVSFDRSDRLWEIEDANYSKEGMVARGLVQADYNRLANEAGFTPTGGFEQKPRHVELEVTNRQGERLVLHIDHAGVIYKQVWLW